MSRAVWDASAVLLVLFREPSWEDWAPSLPESVVSTVNLTEVMTKIMALGGVPVATREVLNALPIEIRSFTPDLAYLAAKLREPTKSLGLSLGDRACLALGLDLGLPVFTADRIWSNLGLDVEVVVMR